MTEQSSDDLTKSAEQTGSGGAAQPDPPAANQGKDEPIAATPDESGQGSSGGSADAGSSSRVPGDQGEPPREMGTDDDAGAAHTSAAASMPASATGGVPTPGDSHGVAVPAVQAATGTSEQSEKVDGVKITSLAAPGKPDGEVDTRG